MDLSVITEAQNAVKKLLRDYQPVERLDAALETVKALLSDVGELEAAKAKAQAELRAVVAERDAARGALSALKGQIADATGVLDAIKGKLSGIKL